MLQLLDIMRRIPDTIRVPKKVLPDTIPQDTAKTITISDGSGYTQQAADVSPIPPEVTEQSNVNLLLTIAVVLFALVLCFFFVQRYRKTRKPTC